MSTRHRRDLATSLVLAAAALAMAQAMLPPRVDPVLSLTVMKHVGTIQRIDQPRVIAARKQVLLDILDLAHGGRLRHRKLGEIGYGEHYFIVATGRFTVIEPGRYRFLVRSDDGFALHIDGAPVCSHPTTRALGTTVCAVNLAAGDHTLSLDYFQGSGQSGLSVRYAPLGQRDSYWVGEDSRHLRFQRIEG